MVKRAAAVAACQAPGISQRPRRTKKETPGNGAPGLGSRRDDSVTTTTQADQIQGEPLKKRPGKRKKPDNATSQVPRVPVPTCSLSSWGAKRSCSRTAVAVTGSRWRRDWAGLDEGPAGVIAERVLADDVAGYIHFRAICAAWRRCCDDPRARGGGGGGVLDDPRFYPRQWIMLRGPYEALHDAVAVGPHPIRRQFLNTSTGQCIQVDVPELRDHGVLHVTTAEGLLLLSPRKTTDTTAAAAAVVVRLLNPLTRQTAELPAITLTRDLWECSSAGLVDDGTVCLYFPHQNGGTLAIAKPGDDRWALLSTGRELVRPTVYSAGRFYGATTGGAVMTVDMAAAGGGPRLVVAAKLGKRVSAMTDSVHLVDNAGDLILVHHMVHRIHDPSDYGNLLDKMMYMVYRVDLDAGKMRATRNLGGRAIFMDYNYAISVSPLVFPLLSADTIYLGHSMFGNGQRGVYHLRDGSTEPCDNVLCPNGEFRPGALLTA